MLSGINSVNLRSPYSCNQKRQNNVTFQADVSGKLGQKATELGEKATVEAFKTYYTVKPEVQKFLGKLGASIKKCANEGKNKAEK